MNRFAELLDRLVLTPSRNGKLKLITDHFRAVEDPDRGLALAALTGELDIASVKPAMLRQLVSERMDPVLFGYSYDYVGDLAETVSLVWPEPSRNASPVTPPPLSPPHKGEGNVDASESPSPLWGGVRGGGSQEHDPKPKPQTLADVVAALQSASRSDGPAVLARLLDQAETSARFAIIKLVTGGLRIGVSARLAKQALADLGPVDVAEIEELWHGLTPPYAELFAWLQGKAPKPEQAAKAPFRPVMLSNPLSDGDLEKLDPADFAAEWKWDGIRVQAVSEGGIRRLYSRTGDDVSGAFPDVVASMDFDAALDGELLVGVPREATGTFSDLQQRLNRKTVSAKMQDRYPAFVRCYDLLQLNGEDLRGLAFTERRARLETFIATLDPDRFDLSPIIAFESWQQLEGMRSAPPHPIIEGVMLKRLDSAYLAGRPKGPWFKWKRDPHTVDAVLMYAQRGHGKRSSFYSDYTFGVWSGAEGREELVPVGKAYFGFTDEELRQIDKFVRDNTIERFGPVRSVRADKSNGLVLEVAFEGLNRSTRHKSGVAMRFPRISRLRWDKPPAEADRIETLQALLD
ncbi:cisplatin damage response ATP-dependent DNA ligase [Aminobacter niigataensis]|uniref:cisplatin damage response ATP-dependent DNA ligase n=1 Tax=Aminobacter niigataensis TaxID=83265 RepID=UPI0024C8EF1D|nr:cisplatin damage response ATP-dependent DNA ligase [Aminobacter niigataensis]CAI2936228.1 DNA ligase (ATP) [Aminobacter niigataensis]